MSNLEHRACLDVPSQDISRFRQMSGTYSIKRCDYAPDVTCSAQQGSMVRVMTEQIRG